MARPRGVRSASERLARIYREAQREIEREIAVVRNDPLRFRQLRRLRDLERRVDTLLATVDQQAEAWVRRDLVQVYVQGGQHGARVIGDTFSLSNRDAINHMAEQTFDELLSATRYTSRQVKLLIRQVARAEITNGVVLGRTARDIGKRIEIGMAQRGGVHGVRYRNGARVGMDTYAEMLARTKTATAYNLGSIHGSPGVRFYEIIDGPNCGWSRHDDLDLADGKIVSRDDALGNPIAHPNCVRTINPRPDIGSRSAAQRSSPLGRGANALPTARELAGLRPF